MKRVIIRALLLSAFATMVPYQAYAWKPFTFLKNRRENQSRGKRVRLNLTQQDMAQHLPPNATVRLGPNGTPYTWQDVSHIRTQLGSLHAKLSRQDWLTFVRHNDTETHEKKMPIKSRPKYGIVPTLRDFTPELMDHVTQLGLLDGDGNIAPIVSDFVREMMFQFENSDVGKRAKGGIKGELFRYSDTWAPHPDFVKPPGHHKK